MSTFVYVSPGLFDMGGIARYGRAQVHSLRTLYGRDSAQVISMLAPAPTGFDEPIHVDAIAGGNRFVNKLKFAAAAAVRARPGRIYWSGHINYAAMVVPLAAASGGDAVINIYGLEVWSNRSKLKEACLARAWVIADCKATRDVAISMGIVDPERSTVIHDPVDVKHFSPGPVEGEVVAQYGLANDDRFRVMFLGRLDEGSKHKGPDRLIRAFAKARLSANAELVIAGQGTQVPVLKQLAADCGASERVKLIGRVPDKELPAIFRAATAFALVSQKFDGGGEGIPLTPLEAGACGLPIIVGDEDGSVEACVDGESGFIVSSRDEPALTAAIESLDQDRDRARRMGVAMSRRAQEMFSLERFVRQHGEFIGRVRPSLAIQMRQP